MTKKNTRVFEARSVAVALMLAALTTAGAGIARAMEIIPSVGVAKSTDSNAGDPRAFGGLAIRAGLLPFLKVEGGIGYRQDSYVDGDLKVRQWPVTASAWLSPLPVVYAGGGVGWYRTTYHYSGSLPLGDTTTKKMGVHLGGGISLPVSTQVGLDVNGRYIFMQKDSDNLQLPTRFNPDFWTGVG